jgi:Domain of unknown function (DUF4397)
MRTRVLRALGLVLVAFATVVAVPSIASAHTKPTWTTTWSGTHRPAADLSVVHGIPGLDVDIYVVRNFSAVKVLRNVHFGTAADLDTSYPGWVTPGVYLVDVVKAGTSPFEPLLLRSVFLGFHQSKTVAAYVTATPEGQAGRPALGVFTNDTSTTNGQARVTVRHLAVAPSVGVYANGAVPLVASFSNGQSASTVVPEGTYDVTVTAPGAPSTVLADLGNVGVAADTNTLAFAVGTFPSTFTVVSLVVPTTT